MSSVISNTTAWWQHRRVWIRDMSRRGAGATCQYLDAVMKAQIHVTHTDRRLNLRRGFREWDKLIGEFWSHLN